MTRALLVLRSATYHWRTNLAVVLGVATAVSVLAGALLVGDSVRGSLRNLALGRLGRTHTVVAAQSFFSESVVERMRATGAVAAPLVTAAGIVTHEPSGRRASNVLVYGVDERFWAFHGLQVPDGVHASEALVRELGAQPQDVLLTRLQRPSEIPLESLFGRRDEVGRTVRLTLSGALPRERLGEFSLQPQQGDVRALFAPLGRVQRDLGVAGKVNAVLLGEGAAKEAVLASLMLEDLGAEVALVADQNAVAIESSSGIMSAPLQEAATRTLERAGLTPVPVFTYLANALREGGREVPYSLVTAMDGAVLDPSAPPPPDAIVLNEWAARDLQVRPGAAVELDYYVWDPSAGLLTRTEKFTLHRVVPIAGPAADRALAPDYPGITGSESVAEWDPPFPLDLSRVRPADEKYWDEYRATPKAFIPYERGRQLWSTRYGAATSVRAAVPAGQDASRLRERLVSDLRARFPPQATGITVIPVRRAAEQGSAGATDFGEYFTYFSFFLVVSALLLAVLFFRLGIEQRLRQIGVLRSTGFSVAEIRSLLLAEAIALAAAGSAIGVLGALAYATLIVYGLRTWWIGAVGTTLLDLHVQGRSLAAGALGGLVTAAICVALSLRAVARLSPRALLSAHAIDEGGPVPSKRRRARLYSRLFALAGVALVAMGFIRRDLQAAAFFAAGAALLAASMYALSAWLRARDVRLLAGRGAWPIARLGFRSAAFRPSRSVLSAALIASAAFIIVAVDAFRRGGAEIAGDARSGTGGYVLVARSEMPIVENPNTAAGRDALGVAPERRVSFTRFRLRPGDDVSCLNLYRPSSPTIVAPESSFLEAGRFSFADSIADSDAEHANPWLLLRRALPDGVIPAIADATSLQYVLHASVGDELTIDIGADRPLRLQFVASLADSVLQAEIVIAEEQFLRVFPGQQGYRMFLIDAPGVTTPQTADSLAADLERHLGPFGFDAVTAAERLESFHRVENTYLSTFQALGGLGLLLGTIGLAAVLFRNVLERRRELALLRAVGYDARRISIMIVAEAAFVLGAGLLSGTLSAAVAVAPAWLQRSGTLPGVGLALLLGGVAVAGLLASVAATRAAIRGNMLAALRAE